MADGGANLCADGIQNDLADNEEEDTKGNVAQRPAVLQGSNDKKNLEGDVDEKLDGVKQVEYDEQSDGVGGAEACPRLEGRKRNQETDGKCYDAAYTEKPDGKRGAVFVQLESNKAVDQQASDECRRQAVLD